MAQTVKLPSGRVVKIPDGLTEQDAKEFIFDKLSAIEKPGVMDKQDLEVLGGQLDTSGWGATAGSIIGGIGGGLAGSLAGPLGTAGGAAAGGAAGGAAGEAFEQWLTGKGDKEDIIDEAKWGVVGGVGGGAAGAGLKVAGKLGAKGLGKVATSGATGAVGGAGAANVAGLDPKVGAVAGAAGLGGVRAKGLLSGVEQALETKLGKEAIKTAKSLGKSAGFGRKKLTTFPADITKDVGKIVKGYLRKKAGFKTGGMEMTAGWLDMRGTIMGHAAKAFIKKIGRAPTKAEVADLEKVAKQEFDIEASKIRDQLKQVRFKKDSGPKRGPSDKGLLNFKSSRSPKNLSESATPEFSSIRGKQQAPSSDINITPPSAPSGLLQNSPKPSTPSLPTSAPSSGAPGLLSARGKDVYGDKVKSKVKPQNISRSEAEDAMDDLQSTFFGMTSAPNSKGFASFIWNSTDPISQRIKDSGKSLNQYIKDLAVPVKTVKEKGKVKYGEKVRGELSDQHIKESGAEAAELIEWLEEMFSKFAKTNDVPFAEGGKVLSDKISKIHGEGYTAPGQAYAIAKSMGYAQGGLLCRK